MPTVLGLTTDSSNPRTSSPSNSSALTTTNNKDKGVSKMAQPESNNSWVSKNKSMGNPDRLNTISKRNHAAALEIETLIWRALCDDPEKAKEYMADDCIMINPFWNHGSSEPVSKKTDPSIEEVLENNEAWQGFRFHGTPLVCEIDLMAVACCYKVSLFKQSKKGGLREVVASVSTSWRQTAGADWLLCAMHVAYAGEE